MAAELDLSPATFWQRPPVAPAGRSGKLKPGSNSFESSCPVAVYSAWFFLLRNLDKQGLFSGDVAPRKKKNKKHCDDKEYKCSQQRPKGYSRLFPFASHILLFVGLGTSGWRRLGNGSDAHNLLNLTDHINATCFDLRQHGHIILTYQCHTMTY